MCLESCILWHEIPLMNFHIDIEREDDGRWIAEVTDLPGVMVYGNDRASAVAKVQALALRVLAERLEHGEAVPEPLSVSFLAARMLL
jgi:predicted RNase H-like HicB family nuclease